MNTRVLMIGLGSLLSLKLKELLYQKGHEGVVLLRKES